MNTDKPILFFREMREPGNVSLYATLKSIRDLMAKNKKSYLRLVLIDPYNKEILVQIWEDHELYASSDMFVRKNLLQIGGPIHLIDLVFDGEFTSSSLKTRINPIPTQHPYYQKYVQLDNYRVQKIIPSDPRILNEIKKLINVKGIVEEVLSKMKDEGVTITEEIFWDVTKLLTDRTYTGTIHLINEQDQLEITQQYTDYVLKQLEIIMIALEHDLTKERVAPIILIRRLQKDLITLYDYSKVHKK